MTSPKCVHCTGCDRTSEPDTCCMPIECPDCPDVVPIQNPHEVHAYRARTTVEAVRVSDSNMEAVAAWCKGGRMLDAQEHPFKVLVPDRVGRVAQACAGDWVIKQGPHFWVAEDQSFQQLFEAQQDG